MHNTPRETLCKIIERYGADVSLDARRCEALLRDLCGTFRKEIFVLVSAAREGIPQALRTTRGMPVNALLAFHSKQMHENLGISEDLCTWAVETWAFSLGVAAANEVHPEIHCPACDVKIRIPERLFGRHARCPKCLTPLTVSVAGVPALRSQSGEPAVFAAPSIPDIEFGPAAPEIVPAPSESAEDIFRQVVLQTIQTSGAFQPEHLPHLDQARTSLGLSYDDSRRIMNDVVAASLPGAARSQTSLSRHGQGNFSGTDAGGKKILPPPIASTSGKPVPQVAGPPPIQHATDANGNGSSDDVFDSAPLYIGDEEAGPDMYLLESPAPLSATVYRALSLEEARRKVGPPASALIATGGLTMMVGGLLFGKISAEEMPRDNIEMLFTGLPILVALTIGVVILIGSIRMMKLESYSWAITAAILSIVPCFCCVIGLPAGIWALSVLGEENVRMAFMKRSDDHG